MQKMKEKFSKIFSDKSKLKSTFVSIVALIIALVISVSTVSAWVETVSTIKVDGSGKIDTKLKTAAVIQSSHADSIDLTQYFRKAGNVHLSEASSVDGNDFYFPIVSSTGTSKYRLGTVNDENVNYIKFSLKVSSSDSKDYGYRLNKVPVIKIGDQTVTNSTVRVAITDETAGTTVLMSHTNSTTAIPAAKDGRTSQPNVKAFSHYVDNDIFTIAKGSTHTITVKLWLQDMNDGNDVYPVSGNTVDVSGFIIEPSIPKHKVKAIAVTDSAQNGTGGTVQVGSATAGATSEEDVIDGGEVTLKATAKTGYKFVGWYTGATSGSSKSSNPSFTLKNITTAQTLYARFVKAYTARAIAVTDGVQSSSGGTVAVGSKSDSADSSDLIQASKTTTFKAIVKANSNYRFVGWYTAVSGGTLKSESATYSNVTISTNTTYYARFVSTYKVTASVVTDGDANNTAGGTVKIGSGSASSSVNDTFDKGTNNIKLTAAANSGYTFEGWYDSATGGSKVESSTTYTINNITKEHNVYARFTKSTKTVYVGVISYEGTQGVNASTLKVHYWNNNGLSGDATVKALGKTYTKHITEWNSNQTFTMYKAELPADATHMKAYAHVNNADRWYGGNNDYVISNGNCLLCYHYSDYRCIQITY